VTFDVPAGAAGVVAAGVLAVVAAGELVVLLLFDDPHPAIARAPTTQVRDDLRNLLFNCFASDSWL
jgi:hypothetical protein